MNIALNTSDRKYTRSWNHLTWFDAAHSTGSITQAFLLLALAIFIRRTLSQALLSLKKESKPLIIAAWIKRKIIKSVKLTD